MARDRISACAAIIWLAVAAIGLALICIVIYLMVDGEPAQPPGSAGPFSHDGVSDASPSSTLR
jgi:hypothetical protein